MLIRCILQALMLLTMTLGVLGVTHAQDESAEHKKRHELEKRLGIQGKKKAPESTKDDPQHGGDESAEDKSQTSPSRTEADKNAAPAHVSNYVDDVQRILQSKCASCHKAGGSAGSTKLRFSGRAFADYRAVLSFVNRSNAAKSPLITKSEGIAHVGGKSLPKGSAGHAALVRWIKAGALYKQPEPAQDNTATTKPERTERNARPRARTPHAGRRPKESATGQSPEAAQSWDEISNQKSTEERSAAPLVERQPTTLPDAEAKAPPAAKHLPFAPAVHQLLTNTCGSCHSKGQFAGNSVYVVPPTPHAHFVAARALVTPGNAKESTLYTYALGHEHAAGAILTPDSEDAQLLASWIEQGAHESVQTLAGASQSTSDQPEPTPKSADNVASEEGADKADHNPHGASPHGASPHGGVSLMSHPVLGTLTLNGRFDLNYERRNYSDNPFSDGADDVLRSYHHFVFLTRQSEQDPVTIKVEMLTLQFWEISMALSPNDWPVKVSTTLGKLLVPFGAEPLFHQTYGGLAGFDQRVVPTVYAREGVKLDAQTEWNDFTFSADFYAIAGYRLREAEAVLNLQSDFAPLEEARIGFGLRLGAAYGPISAWYSAYMNKLGFGRRLFMQALDIALWRPRGVDVLEHFSLGAGFLRADVSGGEEEGYGGPNADYYHFASYFQLRFYPLDWLYLQYRQGLRTFTNRRGLFIDKTDLTASDASTHNIGISARYRGLSVGLFHFWNLEKADEVPDDFTRLVVAYDF